MSQSTPTRQTRAQRRADSLDLSLRPPSPSDSPVLLGVRPIGSNSTLNVTSDPPISPISRRRTSLHHAKDAACTSASIRTRSPVSIFGSPRSPLRLYKSKSGVEASLRAKRNLLNESPSRGSPPTGGDRPHPYNSLSSSPSRRKRAHSSFGIVTVLGKVKGGVCRVQSALERIGKLGEAEDKNRRKATKKWSPRRKRSGTAMHMRLPSDELDKIAPFRKFEQHLDPEPDTDVDMVERPLLSARSMGENMPFDSPMALDGEGPFADIQPPSAMSIEFGSDMNMPLTPLQTNIVEERGGRGKVMQFFGGNPGSDYIEKESVRVARQKNAREKSELAQALLG